MKELELTSPDMFGGVRMSYGRNCILQGLAELGGKEAASLQSDNVLADDGARRLASALRSQPLSINFRRTDGASQASETGEFAGSTLCSKVKNLPLSNWMCLEVGNCTSHISMAYHPISEWQNHDLLVDLTKL